MNKLLAMVGMVAMMALASGCLSSHAVSKFNEDGRAQAMKVDANGVRTSQINWLDKSWLDYCAAHPFMAGIYAIGDAAVVGATAYGGYLVADSLSGGSNKKEVNIQAGGDVQYNDGSGNSNERNDSTTTSGQ